MLLVIQVSVSRLTLVPLALPTVLLVLSPLPLVPVLVLNVPLIST